jgi:hypothetical protein
MKREILYKILRTAFIFSVAIDLAAQTKPTDKDVRIVITGDSNWHRRISIYDDPGYLSLIQKIRTADAAFTNLEVLIHPISQSAQPWAGGGYA